MKTFEITYTLRSVLRVVTFKASTNTVAVNSLLSKLTRRDKAFFKLVSVSLV